MRLFLEDEGPWYATKRLLVLRLIFFEKFARAPMAKSINMVWGLHIARVKTKNILNLRIRPFKAPLLHVELIVLRTDCLRSPPPRLGVWGALVSALVPWPYHNANRLVFKDISDK